MKQEVWVRVDRNGKPVKVALTPRGVAGTGEYGHRVVRYIPEPAPAGAQRCAFVHDHFGQCGLPSEHESKHAYGIIRTRASEVAK